MSASNGTVVPASFDINKIAFSKVKVLDNGGKQVYVNYNGMPNFVVQTPQCTLPYGMSIYDKAGPIKYSVELSMRGYEEDGKMKDFYDMMMALDEHMINEGVKNSRTWFKCEPNREVIKAFYTPTVRFSVDKEGNRKPYPPTIKVQLRQKNGEFETKMYDDKRQPYTGIPMEELLVKGTAATSLIQCTGAWFAGSKFGLSWKGLQMRVDSLPQSVRGFGFVDDDDDVKPASKPSVAKPAMIEDDEEVERDEEEEVPPPPPVKQAAVSKPSVVEAVVQEEEAPEDQEPVVVPKKPATVVKKKLVTKK